jgi:hypothetical protein
MILPHTSAASEVLNNVDLMRLVASYVVPCRDGKGLSSIVTSSPVLPLLLSFRSLHSDWLTNHELASGTTSTLTSNLSDFLESISLVEWAISMGCDFRANDWRVCILAAKRGDISIIEWSQCQVPKYPLYSETCEVAATYGHLEMLQWLRNLDPSLFNCDAQICSAAARRGHIFILEWLRAQKPSQLCLWDEGTCAAAALGGHLDTLKWLRSRDPPCPWDWRTRACAVKSGHYDVVKWVDTLGLDSLSFYLENCFGTFTVPAQR